MQHVYSGTVIAILTKYRPLIASIQRTPNSVFNIIITAYARIIVLYQTDALTLADAVSWLIYDYKMISGQPCAPKRCK